MEINPMHNGHLYFLNEAKKIANGSPLVCVISTNVVQRGQISVLNKQFKTKLLLENGVDIVCELPTVLANQGGEYFALNAVSILQQFGVTNLIFGSETADLALLHKASENTSNSSFKDGIHDYLSNLTSNDILGISYIKAANALNYKLNFSLVKRISNNYNDVEIEGDIVSATAIRDNLHNLDRIAHTLPETSRLGILDINNQLLFSLFKVNLRNVIDNNCNIFLSEDMQLLYKMKKVLETNQPTTINQFLELCKDRNNSKYKFSRILINVVLQIENDSYIAKDYIRVLGFNTKYSKLLPSSAFTNLTDNNSNIAIIEKRSAHLFSLLTNDFQYNEFNRKPLIYKER